MEEKVNKLIHNNDKSTQSKVAYHNDFEDNSIFVGFKATEMNIIAAISSEMLNKGLTEITFDFSYLKKLINWKRHDNDEFVEALSSAYDKLISYNFKIGTKTEFVKFVLFTRYNVSATNQTISVKVNEEFSYILNNLTGNYTIFKLEDFTSFSSKYSKLLYQFLMRWQNKEQPIYLTIDDFKKRLGVPENYRMSNINKFILKPIEKELSNFFEEFRIEKVKKGKSVIKFNFYFKLKDKIIENKNNINNIKAAEIVEEDIFFTDPNLIKLKALFEEIGINFTKIHKKAVEKFLKTNSSSYVLNHFKEQYNFLKNKKDVKNIPGLMSNHLFNGTCEFIKRNIEKKEEKRGLGYEKIMEKFNSLSEEVQEDIINEILKKDKFTYLTEIKNQGLDIFYKIISSEIEKFLD